YEGCELQDEVFIGPLACVTNDLYPRAATADGGLKSADDWQVTPTQLARGASLGAHAVVVAGSHLGAHCMVGAGAVVTREVSGQALVLGNPARFVRWVCVCGRPLNDELRCAQCARAYA